MRTASLTHQILWIIAFLLLFRSSAGTWWFLSKIQVSSISIRILCDSIPGLVRKQRQFCQRYPDIMKSISKAAQLGVDECQYQFRNQRWNCPTLDKGPSVFGKVIITRGSKEAAFVYAISTASVVHTITRSCRRGDLRTCTCDPSKKGLFWDKQGQFSWGGCSDFIGYAADLARKFIDAKETNQRDARALMNLHNNRAGRKVVQQNVRLQCKCHGVSGSCAVRTCWVSMMEFRRVGHKLKQSYDNPVQVSMDQASNNLVASRKKPKAISKSSLIFLESSPDYCASTGEPGSPQIAGRRCNNTSSGADGCDILCCGRGYDTAKTLVVRKCSCRFAWCCAVRCQECREWTEVHTCKPAFQKLQ